MLAASAVGLAPAPAAAAASGVGPAPGAPRVVEVAQVPAAAASGSPDVRRSPVHRTAAAGPGAPAAPATAPAAVTAPSGTGFTGDSYSQQVTAFGADQQLVPPDNGTAANGEFVVHFVNSSGWMFLRNNGGAGPVAKVDLNGFFNSSADLRAGFVMSDPRVVWDPGAGRWFASAVGYDGANHSKEYVATTTGTDPADPTGTWFIYTVWSNNNGVSGDPCNTTSNAYCFGDQPRLGVTSDKVALFWDDYDSRASTPLQEEGKVVSKAAITSGAALGASNSQDFAHVDWFAVVPATDSSAADVWAVYNGTDNSLVSPQFTADGKVHAVRFSGSPPSVNATDTALAPSTATTGAPSMTAPQPGTNAPRIAGDDDRVNTVALQGSMLAASANTTCTIASVASLCVRMWEFGLANPAAPTLTGDVNIGAQGESYYYGAPAFDGSGNLAVVFSTSDASTNHPSVAISGALAASLASFSAPAIAKAGQAVYASGFSGDCTLASGGCRWGDYSSAEADPCDAAFIWTSGEYASSASSPNWATWIAPVTFGGSAAPAACAGAPTISSLSPTSAAAGASVVITGGGFTGATHVYFGTASAAFTVDSATQITATAPAGSGTVDVSVVSPSGDSAMTRPADQFTYTTPPPTPTVSSVRPATGEAGGPAETVTVTGTNFTYPLSAKFGSVGTVGVTSGTTTAFTVTTPLSATGQAVDVQVTEGALTSAAVAGDRFTYVDGGYTLDAYGGLHPFGVATPPPAATGTPTWNWKIARSVAVRPDRASGYLLDGWGGVHPFGGAPAAGTSAYWPNWDVARDIVLDPCDSSHASGYVLDAFGGLHPFGSAPVVTGFAYWSGRDLARRVVMNSCGHGGYTLDAWGGVHAFGSAPAVTDEAYWPNWDIARGLVLTADGAGYTLDGWGGVHPFGGAATVATSGYWSGWDIARSLLLLPGGGGGYVLDGWGGLHQFGSAPAATASGYAPGQDIYRTLG